MSNDFDLAIVEKILDGYVECALWSSTDESDDSGGQPLDRHYDRSDIAPATLEQMRQDCHTFYGRERETLWQASKTLQPKDHDPWEVIGHDFWLTRNGHGAGFWDGDYPEELEERLSKAARQFGEFNLYIGDAGQVWGFGG